MEKILLEFDCLIKYYNISFKNQLNRRFGWSWLLLVSNFLIHIPLELSLILFVSDNDTETLLKFGSMGYMLGGREARLTIEMTFVSYRLLVLYLLIKYRSESK